MVWVLVDLFMLFCLKGFCNGSDNFMSGGKVNGFGCMYVVFCYLFFVWCVIVFERVW